MGEAIVGAKKEIEVWGSLSIELASLATLLCSRRWPGSLRSLRSRLSLDPPRARGPPWARAKEGGGENGGGVDLQVAVAIIGPFQM